MNLKVERFIHHRQTRVHFYSLKIQPVHWIWRIQIIFQRLFWRNQNSGRRIEDRLLRRRGKSFNWRNFSPISRGTNEFDRRDQGDELNSTIRAPCNSILPTTQLQRDCYWRGLSTRNQRLPSFSPFFSPVFFSPSIHDSRYGRKDKISS